jgi:hypothetical protein
LGALLEINEIKMAQPEPELFWGWNIDRPKPVMSVDALGLLIEGWVLGRNCEALALEVRQHGHRLPVRQKVWPPQSRPRIKLPRGQLSIGSWRPDVGEAFPQVAGAEFAGFGGTVSLSIEGANAELEVWVILRDQRQVHLGSIRGRNYWRGSKSPKFAGLTSIVIPCYNQERFLADAIESALGQTCQEVEVVVVDDGSHDNTAAVAARYPTVRYLNQTNKGLSEARNAGLRATNGDFLIFLDADDRLVSNAVERGVEFLSSNPEIAFVSGHYNLIATDGSLINQSPSCCVEKGHFEALLRSCYVGLIGSAMFRRSLFEHVGGFAPSLRACEDYDLYLRVARDFPVACHHSLVADHRVHGASMSRRPDGMLRAAAKVLQTQSKYSKQQPELREAHRSGKQSLRGLYSSPLVDDISSSLRESEWRRALKGIGTITRYDPGALVQIPSRSRSAKTRMSDEY